MQYVRCTHTRDTLLQDIRNRHYRIEERYFDKLPTSNILWQKTDIESRWCLYACQRDDNCTSIFIRNGNCYGYPTKLHESIYLQTEIGMKYYELSGPIGNVAAGKPANQSSYLFGTTEFGPGRAVDSLRYPHQDDRNLISCSHTADVDDVEDSNPFWEVNLESRHLVFSLSFLSRSECCGERNQRLNITVAETASGPRALCLYYPGPPFVEEMKTFFCDKPVAGQFVRISRDQPILNPCEIEIYGYPLN
ncbi:uncharacterized protein [Argopecten irradians]|uniref:uncharacterized protein n=1 Tax=Argopecten irradians TaxID=31199 RepID=UPI0037142E79